MSTVSYKEVIKLKFNLAPSQLKVLEIPNKKVKLVRDLLDRDLKNSDKGNEVGSINYISNSTHYFIKVKAFQSHYFIPEFTTESTVPIRPQSFIDYTLKEGDLLISKDSNIGESVILDKDYPNYTLSGAIYKLPITKYKYYLFAFLKHEYFIQQLDLLVPKGSTIRHAKTLFLDCKIPFPNQSNSSQIIDYIENLTKAILNKEKEIRSKSALIFETIERELFDNQKTQMFNYKVPSYTELNSKLRIDSGYYSLEFKEKQFLISNYIYGANQIEKWNYNIKRGQNLQVSQIGKSIYTSENRSNYYTLVRPTNFSDFGTIEKVEYLGNSKSLSMLEAGDIVFSGEGTVGKCVLFTNPEGRWITNIHGIILNKKDHNILESAFVSCFLRFLRHWNFLDYITVGGQGGSLAMKYWQDIFIPNFPENKQLEIARLYHKPTIKPQNLSLENFIEKDSAWNKEAGVIELDESIKQYKDVLNGLLNNIVNNLEVEIKL